LPELSGFKIKRKIFHTLNNYWNYYALNRLEVLIMYSFYSFREYLFPAGFGFKGFG